MAKINVQEPESFFNVSVEKLKILNEEIEKFAKKRNKAAGARARKYALELINDLKNLRSNIQHIKKNLK